MEGRPEGGSLAGDQGPVPQNFPKSIPKFLPNVTFTNLKYTR